MSKKKHFKIATRESPLAIQQALIVKEKLESLDSSLVFELKNFKTEGDVHLKTALHKIGGKGLFVKALEDALLKKEVDLAVHSVKDIPNKLPRGLKLGAFLDRDHPFDVLVSPKHKSVFELPRKSVVGTSSLRRQTQLRALRSDLQVRLLRGNIQTRLEKLEQGAFDAIILAQAGLLRLKMQDRITQVFPVESMVPAVGQGALGVECRTSDKTVLNLLEKIHDPILGQCLLAERSFNAVLGGSCHTPIGAYAKIDSKEMILTGVVGALDPHAQLYGRMRGLPEQAKQLGEALANKFLRQGAQELLDAFV